jgi:hypothetical protein
MFSPASETPQYEMEPVAISHNVLVGLAGEGLPTAAGHLFLPAFSRCETLPNNKTAWKCEALASNIQVTVRLSR